MFLARKFWFVFTNQTMAQTSEAFTPAAYSSTGWPALADLTNRVGHETYSQPIYAHTASPATPLESCGASNKQGTPTCLVRENESLRAKLKQAQVENAALRKTMFHCSLFDKASTCGLVKRRGVPVKEASKRAPRREAAAKVILEMSIMVQGPEIGPNIIELVKVAASRDPSVTAQLGKADLLPVVMEEVSDKRYKDGVRLRKKKICSKRNGWLWQAMTTTKNQAILAMRTLMGKQVIDDPKCLQSWAAVQPELPSLEFVHDGSSAIWVPPLELFDKLLSNPKIADTLSTNTPYDKLQDKTCFCILVRAQLAITYTSPLAA